MNVNAAKVNKWVLDARLTGGRIVRFETDGAMWYADKYRAMAVPKSAAYVDAPYDSGAERNVTKMLIENPGHPLQDTRMTMKRKHGTVHIFTAQDGTEVAISEKWLKDLPAEYVLYAASSKPDQSRVIVQDQYSATIAVFMPVNLKREG